MLKLAISTALALGLGVAGISGSQAAAVAPAASLQDALAAIETIEQAQHINKRAVVGPRGGVVKSTTVVGPRGGYGRRATVVGPGPRGVYRGGVVGRPAYIGRPAYVRAYRPWVRRPYFGTVVGGIALGTILTVATVGAAPAYAPAPDTCWYWADPSMTTGYWDYC